VYIEAMKPHAFRMVSIDHQTHAFAEHIAFTANQMPSKDR
jgi:hypothetical protein